MRINRQILTIFSLILVSVAIGVPAGFCISKGITSREDLRNYLSMRSSASPVMLALDSGKLKVGSTIDEMLAIETPISQEQFGQFVIYQFRPIGSYDSTSAASWGGRLTAAHAGGCTWWWTYFDQTPSFVREAVSQIRDLRRMLKRDQTHSKLLGNQEQHLLHKLSKSNLDMTQSDPSGPAAL